MKKFSILVALFAFNQSALAIDFSYYCKFAKGNNLDDNFTLKIIDQGKSMMITMDNGTIAHGKYDPTYKPSGNINFVRFITHDYSSDDEYTPEFLIEKNLLQGGKVLTTGQKGGTLKYQARGEGYFSGSYTCVAKQ